MEAFTAREFEGGFNDIAVGGLDFVLDRGEVLGVNYDQRPERTDLRFLGESTGDAAVAEARVVGAVVREGPAEDVLVETLHGRQVGCGKFDVINSMVHEIQANRNRRFNDWRKRSSRRGDGRSPAGECPKFVDEM